MRRHSHLSYLVLPLLAALFSSACDDAGGPAGAGNPTNVTVLLTDAPGDVVHAWVDIDEVYLQGGDGEEGDAAGRVTLFAGPSGSLDLIALIDEVEELANVVIPSGRYGQLRVVLNGAAIQLDNGEIYATEGFDPPVILPVTGELVCPSCSTSGFKVLLQGRELDLLDAEELLVLDFDAGESFVKEAGNTGRWIVTPVIKLFEDPDDTDD
jgi:hypothetical protein